VKTCTVNSVALGNSMQCRLDAKYNEFVSVQRWTIFPEYKNHCAISDVLSPLPVTKTKKGDLEESTLLINISDQEAGSGRLVLSDEPYVDTIGSDKTNLNDCDIMVSKLGMPRGYIYLKPIVETSVIGSSEFIPYTFYDKSKMKYYLYFLLSPTIRKVYACLESGKTPSHKRVNPAEFLKIKIPKLPDSIIDDLIVQIEDCERHIKDCRQQIMPQDRIVNRIFSEHFGFPSDLKDRFGKGMSAGTQNSKPKGMRVSCCNSRKLARNKSLRLSARANNDATQELMEYLTKMPSLYVKDVVIEEIHRGVGPSYDEDGEIPVVKTAHLRNGEVLTSAEEFVTEEFYNKKPRAQVHKGDILLASTGKPSIGKIDLVENNVDYFADGHVSIIRIDEDKYNKKFFVFWFRCILGYFQIERDYVGCTNQIELYEEQIKNFIIPDIPISEQITIVNMVERELQIQENAKQSIKQYRNHIDEIILEAIETRRK